MRKGAVKIDLTKLLLYLLKRVWIILICAAIGFAGMYMYAVKLHTDSYTSSGTMYVVNNNPNLYNYSYTSTSDLNSAVALIDLYTEFIKTDRVLDKIAERLTAQGYVGITNNFIKGSIVKTESVNNTPLMRVYCRTTDPVLSRNICEAVLDVAPGALSEITGAGDSKKIDSAYLPGAPDGFSPKGQALMGALGGAVAAAAVLVLIFMLNGKITDKKDITDNYTPPVLACVKRDKRESEDPGAFLLNSKSDMDITESYSKLRMNLFYTLVDKDSHAVGVTSAISGEGKSTITANLAISCAMSGKKVLLIDADMRRACQRDLFHYRRKALGLSNVLVGQCDWRETIIKAKQHEELDIMPAGQQPPNPAELLDSVKMRELLSELSQYYELILLDAPPINIVSDPLALSNLTAGSLFVVRQNFTDHRELKKGLAAAELTGMKILGFVFYGEKIEHGSYYYRRYYRGYYHKYDTRAKSTLTVNVTNTDNTINKAEIKEIDEASRRTKANEDDKENGAAVAVNADTGADNSSDSGN